jgi:hypothetical protein
MVQAFVLIQAGVGMASRVGPAVSALQGVRSTDIVTGPTTWWPGSRPRASMRWGGWSSRGSRPSRESPGP